MGVTALWGRRVAGELEFQVPWWAHGNIRKLVDGAPTAAGELADASCMRGQNMTLVTRSGINSATVATTTDVLTMHGPTDGVRIEDGRWAEPVLAFLHPPANPSAVLLPPVLGPAPPVTSLASAFEATNPTLAKEMRTWRDPEVQSITGFHGPLRGPTYLIQWEVDAEAEAHAIVNVSADGATAAVLPASTGHITIVAFVDLDGDGIDEIVAQVEDEPWPANVALYRGTGTGRFLGELLAEVPR